MSACGDRNLVHFHGKPSLPFVPHSVGQQGFGVGLDCDRENDCARVELLELGALLENAPIRRVIELLKDLDDHRLFLMVSDLDFEFLLENASGNIFEVGLLALTDNVERVADIQHHPLVPRGVIDEVIPDELQ